MMIMLKSMMLFLINHLWKNPCQLKIITFICITLHPRVEEAKDYFEKLAVKAANIFQNRRLDKLDPIFMRNSYQQMALMSRYICYFCDSTLSRKKVHVQNKCTIYVTDKEFFRTCNVLPFSCTHLAL